MANPAVAVLDAWLINGKLSSTFGAAVHRFRQRAANLREDPNQDYPAQEAQAELSQCVEPVARGLLQLALADARSRFVSVVPFDKLMVHPRFSAGFDSQAVVVEEPDIGNSQYGLFSPFASWRIQAMVLTAGLSSFGERAAQIDLVVLGRSSEPYEITSTAYQVVGVKLDGTVDCTWLHPTINPLAFLKKILGVPLHTPVVLPNPDSEQNLEEALFPGVRLQLAKVLPQLADRFSTFPVAG